MLFVIFMDIGLVVCVFDFYLVRCLFWDVCCRILKFWLVVLLGFFCFRMVKIKEVVMNVSFVVVIVDDFLIFVLGVMSYCLFSVW